ncbi:MAG TPA: hypothetical protein VJ793_02960 [Anaerolineae bacterium]|nr:hypothetical protein [Anaerolineae bacterium]
MLDWLSKYLELSAPLRSQRPLNNFWQALQKNSVTVKESALECPMDKERIRSLLRQPLYRARLAVFMLLGVVLFLAALLVNPSLSVSSILIDFAIVFVAVGLISFMWDFLGGDPIELQITRHFSELHDRLDSTRLSMSVLSDIVDRNIGIERIWPNRGVWATDPDDGPAVWKERVYQAKKVDMVSNTLWSGWFGHETFRTEFFKRLANGNSARILIYDPRSSLVGLRATDEQDPQTQIRTEIKSTLEMIARGREGLNDVAKKNLEIRLTTSHYHLAQIIRVDGRVLVTIYLSGKSGTPSPILQLRGPDTEYFKTYLEQIEILWRRGREVSDDEFRQILAKAK